jgi:hypothetical protein
MCVTNVYTDRYPDGKELEFRQTVYCQDGQPLAARPCQKLSTLEHPVRKVPFGEPTTEYMMTTRPPQSSSTDAQYDFSGDEADTERRRPTARVSKREPPRPIRQHKKERVIIVDDQNPPDEEHPEDHKPTIRRSEKKESIGVPSNWITKAQADYAAMPPPTSPPGILRRSTKDPRAPIEYNLEPYLYEDSRTQFRREIASRQSISTRHSVSYDPPGGDESVGVEAAKRGRRGVSYYESPLPNPNLVNEDKLRKAATYQEDVVGPMVPFTTETLKRQQRRSDSGYGGSSRSTQSRDETDYKKSAITRTTRSLSNYNDDENVTIKVTGQARVMVGVTQINCDEGGEITIKRRENRHGCTECRRRKQRVCGLSRI